ncbi:hypothetical protein TNIN_247301 [Trichonephila inaurata madagascariensis]|uniref:Uncharacterized protein n=1 Tax=Trichonephila inaurata madagascariensis TaxID=2747483 RepID=A0A8X7C226_9ARAC|nr:hypothetical protein TNIN_247301 [Trichonephila inaurata madagascariensis]
MPRRWKSAGLLRKISADRSCLLANDGLRRQYSWSCFSVTHTIKAVSPYWAKGGSQLEIIVRPLAGSFYRLLPFKHRTYHGRTAILPRQLEHFAYVSCESRFNSILIFFLALDFLQTFFRSMVIKINELQL